MYEANTTHAVHCNVESCAYQDGHGNCCAKSVNVGPQVTSSAVTSSAETACVTYRPKQ